ncbi:AEC family transporter [Bacteroidales bacterium OttesenSCG-928-M11]|nr:AEC family transporter [Bacteroidales bacterium OttesenSCG-928-M11]
MVNFILIFLCISVGVIFSKLRILPADSHKSVNAWVLYVALPALAFRFVPEINWGFHILISILGPILICLGAYFFVQIYDRKRRLSKGSRTALFITCALGNTSFIGFPMISAFYGEGEVHHAVVFDQITFILFSTVGVISILRNSEEMAGKVTVGYILKKIFRFPPFLACMLALIVPVFIDVSAANPFLDKMVATLSPMALFSIGLQLKLGAIKQEWRLMSAGLFYKLLLAPALVLSLALLLGSSGNIAQISVFEAGMSSHITASLLASQYNMNPRYCSLVVGVGIILSFITSACWYFFLPIVLP